jgi:N-acetylmuramoyl-L-alanine amidase
MVVMKRSAPRWLAGAWRRRTIAIPVVLAAVVTASTSGYSLIRIHPGDTLSAIALRYHTTVPQLVALNRLPGDGDLIYAGRRLKVPDAHARTGRATGAGYHTVVRGDTLDGIAANYHVSPTRIAERNHLSASLVVVLGSRLAIPRHRSAHDSRAPVASGLAGAVEQERETLRRRAEPTRDQVASMIRSTAARWGLDPRLALAVSWQESGWNMRVVSGAGAIGAMQVMPSTAGFLSEDVVHRALDIDDARDNITAGVALLSVLTHEASSTPVAVAGYYQGLQSVRRHGMLRSTKQYVADVLALREQY